MYIFSSHLILILSPILHLQKNTKVLWANTKFLGETQTLHSQQRNWKVLWPRKVSRSRRSDVETRCAAPCLQAEECTRVRRGTFMNARQRLTWKRRNCWIKSLFLFSLHTKSILIASKKYGWTTDVIWTILMMSIVLFWALIMVVPLLSMEGQKALRFHQKYLNLCSEDECEGLMGLQWHEGE